MKKLTLLLSFFIGTLLSYGQSYQITTIKVNGDEGLSSNVVNDILQDRRGSIWMATDQGITITNGVGYKYLTEKDGLKSNIVNCIHEDKDGRKVWIGTKTGLAVFNGDTIQFFGEDHGLGEFGINCILEDANSKLWIGTQGGGVYTLDNANDSVLHFQHFEPAGVKMGDVFGDIVETAEGQIWLGGEGEMFFIDGEHIKRYPVKFSNYSVVNDILIDVSGGVWVGTNDGLLEFNGRNFDLISERYQYPFEGVLSLQEDDDGNIWIGTYRQGLFRLKPGVNEIINYNSEKGLSEDIVNCVFIDESSNIWAGTERGGVNKLREIAFSYFNKNNGLPNDKIVDVIQDSEERMWFATRKGLIKYEDGKYYTYTESNGLPDVFCQTVYEDSKNNIWVGTTKGVARIENDSVVEVMSYKQGLTNPVNTIYEDSKGAIWLGTQGGGIVKYEDSKFTSFSLFNGLSGNWVTSIVEDAEHTLWIGTFGGGISRFNGYEFIHYKKEDGISSNYINCIVRDPRGAIFIGTKAGITKWEEGEILVLNESNGLSSKNVGMLIFDEDNRLWVGTENGLDRISFNPPQVFRKTGVPVSEIKHFGIKDGYTAGEVNKNAVCEDEDGNLWFGTNSGVAKLDLSVDDVDEFLPPTYITNILIGNESSARNWKRLGYDVDDWVNIPKNLVLPYDSSTITFEFVGINHKAPKKVKYQWFLEGLSNDTTLLSTDRKKRYDNLPPGNYRFVVIACSNEDFCNYKEPAVFEFEVSPPFWQETWFMVTMGIFVGGIVFGFIKRREKKLVEERAILEQKVKERTQEVVDKNKELELVNLEIISKNKEIEQKNTDLNSSIRYALTIQEASFPPVQDLKDEFANSFIYHLPRDIVSGDFYWYRKVDNKFVMAIADCTGHGVPGALTSMIGIALLNEIVAGNKITDPALALAKLDEGILKAFENSESETNDGMDIALISIDKTTQTIEFAGAYRPLILIRDGELTEFKATKMSIGFKDVYPKEFEKSTFQYQHGDNIYMFSDGYPDQFGGPNNKKFKTKIMKEMLQEASHMAMMDQKSVVDQRYLDWKGPNGEQVDDILVAGIKF